MAVKVATRDAAPSALAAPTTAVKSAIAAVDAARAADTTLGLNDDSNTILDPDNDSYYLMDAVLNRLTLLIDSAWRAGDLQRVILASGHVTLAKRLAIEDLKGTILTTQANSDPDYAAALQRWRASTPRSGRSRCSCRAPPRERRIRREP